MSDQVPVLRDTVFDGSTLINVKSGGIISINADTTPAQILQGDFGVRIFDLGGGVHQFNQWSNFITVAFTATVPDNTPTIVLNTTVPVSGEWLYVGNVRGAIIGPTASHARILSGVASVSDSAHFVSPAGVMLTDAHSLISYMNNNAGGESISLELTQVSGAPIDYDCVMTIYRIGL